jgi:hypothetical protein
MVDHDNKTIELLFQNNESQTLIIRKSVHIQGRRNLGAGGAAAPVTRRGKGDKGALSI